MATRKKATKKAEPQDVGGGIVTDEGGRPQTDEGGRPLRKDNAEPKADKA